MSPCNQPLDRARTKCWVVAEPIANGASGSFGAELTSRDCPTAPAGSSRATGTRRVSACASDKCVPFLSWHSNPIRRRRRRYALPNRCSLAVADDKCRGTVAYALRILYRCTHVSVQIQAVCNEILYEWILLFIRSVLPKNKKKKTRNVIVKNSCLSQSQIGALG